MAESGNDTDISATITTPPTAISKHASTALDTEISDGKHQRSAQKSDKRRRDRQRKKALQRFCLATADYGTLPGRYSRPEFVANLKQNSRACELSDNWKDVVAASSKSSKEELLDWISAVCRHPLKSDCTIVHNAGELSAALRTAYDLIFAPGQYKLGYTQDWTIEKQILQLGNGTVEASRNGAFETFNAERLRQVFGGGDEIVQPFNVLDLQYWQELSFLPTVVFDHSLLHQLDLMERAGKQGRCSDVARTSEKWMILTHGPIDSPFHADQGGKCTIVCGIEGEKIWHVPVGDRSSVRKLFRLGGDYETRFLQGSVRMVIGPGDILIQPPGRPHAVVTPNDALIAGIFIYTAATYHQSIECLALWLQDELSSNDDMTKDDISNHTRILEHFHTSLFNDVQRGAVLAELFLLLRERDCISEEGTDKGHVTWVIQERSEWNLKAPNVTPAVMGTFLQACVKAWDPNYASKIPAKKRQKQTHGQSHKRRKT